MLEIESGASCMQNMSYTTDSHPSIWKRRQPIFILLVFHWLLCTPGWPWTQRAPPAITSWVLELKDSDIKSFESWTSRLIINSNCLHQEPQQGLQSCTRKCCFYNEIVPGDLQGPGLQRSLSWNYWRSLWPQQEPKKGKLDWWLYLENSAVSQCHLPLLATCKDSWQF